MVQCRWLGISSKGCLVAFLWRYSINVQHGGDPEHGGGMTHPVWHNMVKGWVAYSLTLKFLFPDDRAEWSILPVKHIWHASSGSWFICFLRMQRKKSGWASTRVQKHMYTCYCSSVYCGYEQKRSNPSMMFLWAHLPYCLNRIMTGLLVCI